MLQFFFFFFFNSSLGPISDVFSLIDLFLWGSLTPRMRKRRYSLLIPSFSFQLSWLPRLSFSLFFFGACLFSFLPLVVPTSSEQTLFFSFMYFLTYGIRRHGRESCRISPISSLP